MSEEKGWLKTAAREIFSQRERGITVYHYFARCIGLLLSVAVSIIMLLALYYLFKNLTQALLSGPAKRSPRRAWSGE